jgi:hypothetical protein
VLENVLLFSTLDLRDGQNVINPFDCKYSLKGSTSEVVPLKPCIIRQPILCFIKFTAPSLF